MSSTTGDAVVERPRFGQPGAERLVTRLLRHALEYSERADVAANADDYAGEKTNARVARCLASLSSEKFVTLQTMRTMARDLKRGDELSQNAAVFLMTLADSLEREAGGS